MEETSKRRWTTVVFFSALLLLFCGFIYFLVFMPKDSRYSRIRSQSQPTSNSTIGVHNSKESDRVVLPLDQRIVFNDLILIYRGKRSGTLFLDVIITDLDPNFAYHHAIPTSEAKKEFNVASQRFKLISSSNSLIRIEHLH